MMLQVEPLLGWTPAQMIARRKELRAKFWGHPRRLRPVKRIETQPTLSAPIERPAAPRLNACAETPQSARTQPSPAVPKITIELIINRVAAYYQIPAADLKSPMRKAAIVRPRQIACYLAKTLTARSTTEIGRRLGRRDHTTVLHAVRKIADLLPTDEALAEDLRALEASLAIEPRPSLQ